MATKLSKTQMEQYNEEGFALVESALPPNMLSEMLRLTDEVVEGASGLADDDDRYDLEDQVYLELKRRDIIQAIKNKAPEINIFVYLDFEPSFELINELGLQGITIAVDNITKNQVQQAHDNGTMVAVFNTNSKSKNIDAIEKNVE